jgi:hypothetical protein
MHKLRYLVLSVAQIILLSTSVWAAQNGLASADWSADSSPSLAAHPPNDDAILDLLNKLQGAAGFMGICSAQFANLRHGTNLSLVVSATDGRQCGFLSIVDKTSSGFELYESTGGEIEGIKDLTGDGNLELIVNFWDGDPMGSSCVPKWPVIFAWDGHEYANVSDQYKGYYEEKLNLLKEQTAEVRAAEQAQEEPPGQTPAPRPTALRHILISPSTEQARGAEQVQEALPDRTPASRPTAIRDALISPTDAPKPTQVQSDAENPAELSPATTSNVEQTLSDPDCGAAEASRIERFLGVSPEAGLHDAIGWANSSDPRQRELAVFAFLAIGTPSAVEQLRTLSYDTDHKISSLARFALGQVGRTPPVPQFEREDTEPITD